MANTKIAALLARLYDKTQLVRTIPLAGQAPDLISVPEFPPPRLRDLDFDLPLVAPVSQWQRVAWANTDFLTLDEWIREYKDPPPNEHILDRTSSHEQLVVVRYVDYQRVP